MNNSNQVTRGAAETVNYLHALAKEALEHGKAGDFERAANIYGHAMVEATKEIVRLQARVVELEKAKNK